jgi:uncharacterized protein (TIGR02246 family)
MSTQSAIRVLTPSALVIVAVGTWGLGGALGPGQAGAKATPQAEAPSPAPVAGARAGDVGNTQAAPSEDERAIRAVDESFVREYNAGDTKALAARFTEDAEVVEADGERYQGREIIEQRLAETFAESPGVKMALEIEAIRLLDANVAKEEGRTVVTPAKGAPLSRRYTVLYVRHAGRWLISSVREEPDPLVRTHDRLKDLEWMVGEWVDEAPDSVVRVNCRWSDDANFLIRSFTVRLQGKPVMTVSQRIGWDPLARQIRSWEFDSEGGFGEGLWSRDGDRWVIKHRAVRPDGVAGSATNIMSRERPDLVHWVSTDRVLGDESLPDGEPYVLVRVAPAPGMKPKGQAPPSSSSSSTGSPR